MKHTLREKQTMTPACYFICDPIHNIPSHPLDIGYTLCIMDTNDVFWEHRSKDGEGKKTKDEPQATLGKTVS